MCEQYTFMFSHLFSFIVGCMRSFFYVDTGFGPGDCVRITNYGIRLMRIVIHRKTSVEL